MIVNSPLCCILSKFYIKPQLKIIHSLQSRVVSYRNSTSNHNPLGLTSPASRVVSYRNSTSNHNSPAIGSVFAALYLIEILHQTTTPVQPARFLPVLYLIEILHQTTTTIALPLRTAGCILSKFYIKPQPATE